MEKNKSQDAVIRESMQAACDVNYDLLDGEILCQSVSFLPLKAPVTVPHTATVEMCLELLQSHKTGSVLVLAETGAITGIFTERDFILKVAGNYSELKSASINDYMTTDPVIQTSECTIAYALTLMSEGGFRNLPIVDASNIPVGVIAVKDIIDYLVTSFMNKLLSFPEEV